MTQQTPNVLFILCDQLRYDCVGFAGCHPIRTPNMDRLAQEGVFFKNAYTPLPVCGPARQAIFTGKQPDSFGAFFNHSFAPVAAIEKNTPSWITSLKQRDYTCGHAGKWDIMPHSTPSDFGYEALTDMGAYHRNIQEKYGDIAYEGGWLGCANPIALEDSVSCYIAAQSATFIEKAASEGKPWHLWMDLPDPHLPCRPSAPFDSMYAPDAVDIWNSFPDTHENKPYIQKRQTESWGIDQFTWKDFAPTVARYYGMVSQVDYAIGMVLSALEKTGCAENTLVILTSDHGDTCGGHGMLDKHYILYDDVTHVPLIVRYPKKFTPGVCEHFVSSGLDVAPTVAECCGMEDAFLWEGHGFSLCDAVNGKSIREFSVSTSNGQQFGLFTQRCIRTYNYKYIWNLTDIDEFYDLKKDPGELVNRIEDSSYTDIIHELGANLYKELCRLGDPFANNWVKYQLTD